MELVFDRSRNGREWKVTIQSAGGSPLTVRADLTDDVSRKKAEERIVARFPGIDLDDLRAQFDQEAARKEPPKGKLAEQVLEFLERECRLEPFHAPDATPFARVAVRGAPDARGATERKETVAIRSQAFREWLTHEVYVGLGRPPTAETLTTVVAALAARARYEGPELRADVRLAEHAGAIWLDLANDAREMVRVDSSGWGIVPAAQAPVRLVRRNGLLALPRPVRNGSIEELRGFLNLDDAGWVLVRGFALMLLSPTGPYPILIVNGEQGSAKSTLSKVVRRLVDPNELDARRPPREPRDLAVAAANSRLIVCDNLSGIPDWLADDLCALTSGNGFATRALYTDGEEAIFRGARPVILNGIDDLAIRGDIQDRAILLHLARIDDAARRDEREFWARFEEARPRLLGALLDALVTALARRGKVAIQRNVRLADFGRLVEAGAPALGLREGEFLNALFANRARGSETVLEASPFALALQNWMGERTEWSGTAEELRTCLTERGREAGRAWPGSARKVGDLLRRFAPALRECGIEIILGERESDPDRRRLVRIRNLGNRSSTPSEPLDDVDGLDDVVGAFTCACAATNGRTVLCGMHGGGVDDFD